jgi:hypothetical protein
VLIRASRSAWNGYDMIQQHLLLLSEDSQSSISPLPPYPTLKGRHQTPRFLTQMFLLFWPRRTKTEPFSQNRQINAFYLWNNYQVPQHDHFSPFSRSEQIHFPTFSFTAAKRDHDGASGFSSFVSPWPAFERPRHLLVLDGRGRFRFV